MALSGMRSSFPREYANRFEGMRRGERREDEEVKGSETSTQRRHTHSRGVSGVERSGVRAAARSSGASARPGQGRARQGKARQGKGMIWVRRQGPPREEKQRRQEKARKECRMRDAASTTSYVKDQPPPFFNIQYPSSPGTRYPAEFGLKSPAGPCIALYSPSFSDLSLVASPTARPFQRPYRSSPVTPGLPSVWELANVNPPITIQQTAIHQSDLKPSVPSNNLQALLSLPVFYREYFKAMNQTTCIIQWMI
ncbi:hypothetical protein DL95DRAFT_485272 [Leptodontidium sp. 2 PMI_412]|nr:hypothetical protein DL95DRAFT_485272 [Leptodontidium sp. 2 PMI_412]